MKYIKTYENLNDETIKIGDNVKFINNIEPKYFEELPIYIVTKIDTWAVKYKYYIEREQPGVYKHRWAARDELLLIPKHEIDAKKYNL